MNGLVMGVMASKTYEFDFGVALELLKAGHSVTRKGWNGRGMWIRLQRPDKNSKMTLPYIYLNTATQDLVPWLASQTDMLAKDWVVCFDGDAIFKGQREEHDSEKE